MDKISLPVFVMEKMHNNLRGLVEDCADIPMNITLSILNDVCLGLQYLHTREPPIVHRNLTPNNILLCYHFKAKISDIGIVNIPHTTDTQAPSQTSKMRAFLPLNSLTSTINNLSLDVFSFGGVILYIATNHWPQLTNSDVDSDKSIAVTELQQCQQYLDKMAEGYTKLKPLVASCLDDNSEKRPSVAQVITKVKKVRKFYNEKLYSTLWESEISSEQRSPSTQGQKQKEQQEVHQQETEKENQQKTDQVDIGQPQLLQVSFILYNLLCICVCACMCMCMFVHVCMCMCLCVCLCMCMCVHVCMCAFVCRCCIFTYGVWCMGMVMVWYTFVYMCVLLL